MTCLRGIVLFWCAWNLHTPVYLHIWWHYVISAHTPPFLLNYMPHYHALNTTRTHFTKTILAFFLPLNSGYHLLHISHQNHFPHLSFTPGNLEAHENISYLLWRWNNYCWNQHRNHSCKTYNHSCFHHLKRKFPVFNEHEYLNHFKYRSTDPQRLNLPACNPMLSLGSVNFPIPICPTLAYRLLLAKIQQYQVGFWTQSKATDSYASVFENFNWCKTLLQSH